MKRILLLLLILFNLVDFWTTFQIYESFGIDIEKNPLMWHLIDFCGIYGILYFKAGILLFLLAAFRYIKTYLLVPPVLAYFVLMVYQLSNFHNLVSTW